MTFLDRPSSQPQALCNRASIVRLVLLFALAFCVSVTTGCDRVTAVSGVVEKSRAVGKSADSEARGFVCRTFPDETGHPRGYVVFVPHGYRSGSKPPVLLFLNGIGENGDDGLRQISNNFGVNIWETREYFPFLAIAPQCRTEGSWGADSLDVKWALQLLDQTIREFGADEDRIYMTGVSGGGSGVWNVASVHPDRFAAIVPLCGAGGGHVDRLVQSRVSIWNFYNAGDAQTLMESNRDLRRQLIELGSSPIVTEYPTGGHDCWNRAYRTTALYGWLLQQRRSTNKGFPLFRYLPAERLLAEWQSSRTDTWTVGEDGMLIGRGDESHGRGVLVCNTASRCVEVHGDVWLQSDSDCRIGILNEESISANASLWISIVPPDLGTGGVLHANGEWSGRLDPAAQHTLRVDAWNDVRVRCAEGRITVQLNGWPALDLELASDQGTASITKYRCAFATPDDGSAIRWRYVRTRCANDSPVQREISE